MLKQRFTCNSCGFMTSEKPAYKNKTCVACGRGRLKVETLCSVCDVWFKADRYTQKFCSYPCKIKNQTTGRVKVRKTITKARSAQSLLSYHVKKGNVIKPKNCEECGISGVRIEGAHYDYDKPMAVRWLCRSCHVKWDKKEPKGATYLV